MIATLSSIQDSAPYVSTVIEPAADNIDVLGTSDVVPIAATAAATTSRRGTTRASKGKKPSKRARTSERRDDKKKREKQKSERGQRKRRTRHKRESSPAPVAPQTVESMAIDVESKVCSTRIGKRKRDDHEIALPSMSRRASRSTPSRALCTVNNLSPVPGDVMDGAMAVSAGVRTAGTPATVPRRKGTKARITAALKAEAQAVEAAAIPLPSGVPDVPTRVAARRLALAEITRRLAHELASARDRVETAIASARASRPDSPKRDLMRERRERQMRDALAPHERALDDARAAELMLCERAERYISVWTCHHARLCALQVPSLFDAHYGVVRDDHAAPSRHDALPTEAEREALARVDDAQRWALAHHHAATCRSIDTEFAAEFEGAQPPVRVARHDACAQCGGPLRMSVSGSALTCAACRSNTSHMDTTTAAMSYGDDVDIAVMPHKNGGHLDVKLRNFQGKSSKHIDEAVKLQVMQWHMARGFASAADITWKTVRTALKDLECASPKRGYYRRYYDHSMRICCLITGKRAPSMTPDQERLCRAMFAAMQDSFNKWVTTLAPDRVNFISYSHCLHQFFKLRRWHKFLPYFPIIKRPEKLRLQEAIWAGVCFDMEWEFIPSMPPDEAPPSGAALGGTRPAAVVLAEWIASVPSQLSTPAAPSAAITGDRVLQPALEPRR